MSRELKVFWEFSGEVLFKFVLSIVICCFLRKDTTGRMLCGPANFIKKNNILLLRFNKFIFIFSAVNVNVASYISIFLRVKIKKKFIEEKYVSLMLNVPDNWNFVSWDKILAWILFED